MKKVLNFILMGFLIFFIYENIVLMYLSLSNNLILIYVNHQEVFLNRIIYYELSISKFTHFTFASVLKIVMYFLQAIGIVEIGYVLLGAALVYVKDIDNKVIKSYKSVYVAFIIKLLLIILLFAFANLLYYLDLKLAWNLIRVVLLLNVIYYLYLIIKLIKIEFF